jgi:aromatic ring-opening dioxygenase LigB subunit
MTEPAAGYVPVPIDMARQIAIHCRKQIVVIVSIDHAHDRTHFTTYGVEPEDKIIAGRLGEALCQATGHALSEAHTFEDFRHIDAAKRAKEVETLKEILQEVQRQAGNIASDDRRHALQPGTRDRIDEVLSQYKN